MAGYGYAAVFGELYELQDEALGQGVVGAVEAVGLPVAGGLGVVGEGDFGYGDVVYEDAAEVDAIVGDVLEAQQDALLAGVV